MNAVYDILKATKHGAYLKLKSLDLLKIVTSKTAFLDEHYSPPTWPQRFWHIRSKVNKLMLCDVCKNNPAKFHNSYGYVACGPECKNKKNYAASKAATKKKYGVDHIFELKSFRDKSVKTMKKKYGVTNYSYAEDFKEKTQITNLLRHNEESYAQTAEFKQALTNRYRKLLGKRLGNDYEILAYVNKRDGIELKHVCGNTFILRGTIVYSRLNNKDGVCPICHPIQTSQYSLKEKEVVAYIRSMYSNIVLENNKSVVAPFEVDIFLPDLNLAIEFNGTYHHADARFYSNDGFVFHRTVKEIRNKDSRKLKACETAGIMLLVIWEYDWDNHVEDVMLLISEAINNAQDKVINPP